MSSHQSLKFPLVKFQRLGRPIFLVSLKPIGASSLSSWNFDPSMDPGRASAAVVHKNNRFLTIQTLSPAPENCQRRCETPGKENFF